MKKFYSIMAVMMLLPMALSAQTMTKENETLTNMGYILEKDVDFRGGFVNDKEITPANTLEFADTDDGYKLNNYAVYHITNTGLEFMSLERTNNLDINLSQGEGLRSYKNERWFVVNDLREGQILAFDISNSDSVQFVVNSIACNGNTNWADNFCDPLIVEEISYATHAIQEQAKEGSADTYRYFKVINAGNLPVKFNGKQYNVVYRMQIWSDASEAEVVTPPSFSLTKVDGAMRLGLVKPGESTRGSAVTTFYSFEDEEPLFLKDTDVILSADTIWLDEEHTQYELENIVYKKELDPQDGFYGGNECYEDVEISFDNNDDADGDGYVTVNIASVSETGAFSEIASYKVGVGEIDLNQPTLTLVGVDGDTRTYQIGWTNNTLCHEPFTFTASIDDGANIITDLELGSTVTATDNLKVTVEVTGYNDGVAELDELFQEGVDMMRKYGTEKAHDWDFQNLTEFELAAINQQVIDYYAVYDEDGFLLRTYTVEQYENEEIPAEEVVEPVAKNLGWDSADSRNANRHWRTWLPTYALDEEGNPTETVESSVYADETTGMFEGLVVDNQHPSYSTMAIFTDQSGLYFMSKGTIEVTDVKYGEIVMLTTNSGITAVVNEDPVEPVVLNIGQGAYVYNIDIYTYENLPDGITTLVGNSVNDANVYTIDGRIVRRNSDLNGLQKGMYILNGKKIIVK